MRFVERMPDGIHQEIRERGANLSTGQRQLLSFARALAYDPRILVMDEATSSVDSETERLIQIALDQLLTGRTALVIAHRLSTIERADRILVLSNGVLRESGTHEELLKRPGLYRPAVRIAVRRGFRCGARGGGLILLRCAMVHARVCLTRLVAAPALLSR